MRLDGDVKNAPVVGRQKINLAKEYSRTTLAGNCR